MRKAADTDFFVETSFGEFRFARRTYGDRLKIRAEFLRLTREFGDVDDELAVHAAIVSAHKVLCVEAPAGWEDIEKIDLIAMPDAEDKIFELYGALKSKEDSFRPVSDKGGKD